MDLGVIQSYKIVSKRFFYRLYYFEIFEKNLKFGRKFSSHKFLPVRRI